MEVVAEYKGKPNLEMFAQMLATSANEYGQCLLVVENNNIGYNVLEKLIDMNYPNIYYSHKSTHESVDPLVAETMSNVVPGFTTSMKTRPLIIAKLEEFIRNKLLILYSNRVLDEIRTFVWVHGKPQAMRGYNDDLVMSLAIACWIRDTALLANKRAEEYNRACLDAMVVTNTKHSIFRFNLNGKLLKHIAVAGDHGLTYTYYNDKKHGFLLDSVTPTTTSHIELLNVSISLG